MLRSPYLELSGRAWALPWHACEEEDWMKHAFGVLSGAPQATYPFATLFAKYTHGFTSRAGT
eukprot:954178-Pyramimonas_sp.AAC.1